jgi:hypothetical protein|tara:strand:+ start:7248 stop:7826 length:579 start_codon:yes stop_codon:yes gene_type:complete
MSNESLLKKDFKESDVQRVRNLVNKDFTAKTKTQSGYQKAYIARKEGDIWEESSKTWTIKNGLKQNVTKLDAAKKALQVPLACPKCGGPMKHHLAKKMYKIHGFCFDPCTVDYEATLKKVGLYDQYEKRMISGNIKHFITDIEAWVVESIEDNITMVTEDGDVEDWNGMDDKYKEGILKDLKGYTDLLRSHI